MIRKRKGKNATEEADGAQVTKDIEWDYDNAGRGEGGLTRGNTMRMYMCH